MLDLTEWDAQFGQMPYWLARHGMEAGLWLALAFVLLVFVAMELSSEGIMRRSAICELLGIAAPTLLFYLTLGVVIWRLAPSGAAAFVAKGPGTINQVLERAYGVEELENVGARDGGDRFRVPDNGTEVSYVRDGQVRNGTLRVAGEYLQVIEAEDGGGGTPLPLVGSSAGE